VHIHHFGRYAPVQLWLGGSLAFSFGKPSAATGYISPPDGRAKRRREQQAARLARTRPSSRHLAHRGQLGLFHLERDWSSLDLAALPSLTAIALDLINDLERYGHDRAWEPSTVKQASRTLRTLVSWLGADAQIYERDLLALVRRPELTCGRRVSTFLATCGMLIEAPPPVDHHQAAVARLVAAAPMVFQDEIQQ
jgi:hypothetical protein